MKLFARTVLIALLAVSIFTTCDSSPGMGDSIDWEAPVLRLDPKPPTPFYVRFGAELTGTVTDNVAVDRVILRDAVTMEQMFTATLLPNNRWRIDLVFTEEQNGETITVDVVAFDTAGNSDASSIAQVVLVIDIEPPLVEYIEIKRTDTRMSRPEKYSDLLELETTDPRGEKKDNLYRYQNGWFYMNAIVAESETKIDIEFSSLNIYDTREPNLILLSLPIDEGYTAYNPRWTVKEDDIINEGVRKFGTSYKTNYYNGDRYYYRITVYAIDKSNNESKMVQEDEGYICMWAKSDEPKGIYDSSVGHIVSRGTPLPVDFYDDDSLLWAYAGLLTKDQWDGLSDVYDGGVKIPGGTNEQKLLWLKERLTGSTGDSIEIKASKLPIYDWNFDKHNIKTPVTDLINFNPALPKSLDEKVYYIPTGKDDNDYGDYVIFSLAADRKLDPHDGNGPEITNKNIWSGKAANISVIDENVPLIVFDTQNGCPEENTFPDLVPDGGTGNESFTIKGYTLRENSRGETDSTPGNQNKVIKFRMAWIPYYMLDSEGKPAADSYITVVQNALKATNYPVSIDTNDSLKGVQHWEFREGITNEAAAGYGNLDAEPLYHGIPGNTYYKQDFSKKFSVLGKSDSIKPGSPYNYKNFTHSGYENGTKPENETKLFIFYVVDNMGHEVFRQLRLLGMKTPPSLTVYDITNRIDNSNFSGLPDPNETANVSNGIPTPAYYTALNNYNKNTGHDKLKNIIISDSDKSIPFQVYPRGTIIKYWVTTDKNIENEIVVKSITMTDITYSGTPPKIGSNYDNTLTQNMSFCEQYPDVTQRTFLFEAEDELGNKAQVQRTIAVTNAARLENITTTEQSGLYGQGKHILLKANFSSQIYVTGGTDIKLNVRYKNKLSNNYVYAGISPVSIPSESNPSLSLDFDFEVPLNADDVLWTVYDDSGSENIGTEKKPITLGGNTIIMDYLRKGDAAFIPGYRFDTIFMPNWNTNANSLQKNKEIKLDGTPPRITSVVPKGVLSSGTAKSTYTLQQPNGYYMKTGETIELTLTADEPIRANGTPVLQYYVRVLSETPNVEYGPFTTAFRYKQPGTTGNDLVFSLPVTVANFSINGTLRDRAQLVRISLIQAGGITDLAGNNVVPATVGESNLVPNPIVLIKQTVPGKPVIDISTPAAVNASDSNPIGTNSGTTLRYNGNPTLTVDAGGFWENIIEYSTTGGSTWIDYPDTTNPSTPAPKLLTGTYRVQARYEDRAGNISDVRDQAVQVNGIFPKLVQVNAQQSNGWYTSKAGNNKLEFNLNFESDVTINNATQVSITLTNALGTNNENTHGTSPSYQIVLPADSGQTDFSTSIKFTWNNISGKEMHNGLYISSVTLNGLMDRFNNQGIDGTTSAVNGAINFSKAASTNPVIPGVSYSCPNLPAGGIKVDAIAPVISSYEPVPMTVVSDNKTIKLTFNEPVMIGVGKITVRPYGNYRIPPVLETNGYYLNTANGDRYTVKPSGLDTTWVAGFSDIYGALTAATDKNALTQGANSNDTIAQTMNTTNPNMTTLYLDQRTGQSYGPYIKLTHGLKKGEGYTGNYSDTTPGANGPNPETGTVRMIPDTTTKWVLDYKYSIDNDHNTQYVPATAGNPALADADLTVVNNIRKALTNAKWRWQEMELASSVSFSGDEKTVIITLNEPLLVGLQWGLSFPAGTFTDKAGNSAAVLGYYNSDGTIRITYNNSSNGIVNTDTESPYWFWSSGVQDPVIRVNRKSYDARTTNWKARTGRAYDNPTNRGGPGGWGISDFNTVHYRIETETPNATISYGTRTGSETADSEGTGSGRGSITAAWTGTLGSSSWTDTANVTAGTWYRPNLVRRKGSASYTVSENGITVTRDVSNNYQGFRSYNRDIKEADLTATPTTTNGGTSYQGSFTYTAVNDNNNPAVSISLQASKNYVVAIATKDSYTSKKAYEGVFRSVVALNRSAVTNSGSELGGRSRTTNPIMVQGSNVRNGMPSVAGFPVRDAEEGGDNRFIKLFYYAQYDTTNYNQQLLWVSTEIVSQWYELNCGRQPDNAATNGTHQYYGEVNNYLTAGYGDLTYSINTR